MRCTIAGAMGAVGAVVLAGCGSSPSTPMFDATEPPDDAQVDASGPGGEDVETDLGTGRLAGLAIDETHLYISIGTGVVRRLIDGGPIEMIATDQRTAIELDATSRRLFWLEQGTHASDFLDGAVRSWSKTGGDDQELATSYMPTAIALDGDLLFWSEGDGQRVWQIAADGGAPTLVDDSPTFVSDLVVTPSTIYWAASTEVVAKDRATGALTTIAAGEYAAHGIVAAGDDVLWTVRTPLADEGAIRVSRAGGPPQDLAAHEEWPIGLWLDGAYVYWISGDRIRRVSTAGGTPETFTDGEPGARSLAFDATYVYWTDFDRGAIVRQMK